MGRKSQLSQDDFFLGMSRDELMRVIVDYGLIAGTLFCGASSEEGIFPLLREVVKSVFIFSFVHALFYYFDFHGKVGIWGASEPKTHFKFTMETTWIVALYALGKWLTERFMGIDASLSTFNVHWQFNESNIGSLAKYIVMTETPTFRQNIGMFFVLFYTCDFGRYWAHRLGHHKFLYRTFPFAHAHHHNQVFMNPFTNIMSPFCHLASIATYIPILFAHAAGWHTACKWAWVATIFPTITQHLGADPFPSVTRFNHYYAFGLIPWLPHYHAYHHLHAVLPGNFGNTSMFWDYLFGTVTPESIYHIEHGHPTAAVAKFFADPDKLELHMKHNFEGARKNRLDLN